MSSEITASCILRFLEWKHSRTIQTSCTRTTSSTSTTIRSQTAITITRQRTPSWDARFVNWQKKPDLKIEDHVTRIVKTESFVTWPIGIRCSTRSMEVSQRGSSGDKSKTETLGNMFLHGARVMSSVPQTTCSGASLQLMLTSVTRKNPEDQPAARVVESKTKTIVRIQQLCTWFSVKVYSVCVIT